MKKNIIGIASILFLFAMILLVDFYSSKEEYELVTKQQIDTIVEKEKIVVLSKEDIFVKNKPMTLIFYSKNSQIGSIEARNINGFLKYTRTLTTGKNGNVIQTIGAKGDLAYIMVAINDSNILKNTKKLDISDTGLNHLVTKEINGNPYVIVVFDEKSEVSFSEPFNYKFIDYNNETLFECEGC
ncbi:hypothetical protein ABE142_26120 [Paenibacillus alvei]